MIDTLPPGYEYDVKTYKRLDREGKVLSVDYDTTIVPIRYRMDTVYATDAAGNLTGIHRIDSVEVTPTINRATSTESALPPNRLRKPGGASVLEAPVLPVVLPSSAPPTSFAPAAAPKNARPEAIQPLRIKVPHDLPSNDELLQRRLREVVKNNPRSLNLNVQNNGYYPAYKRN
ncbi:MAG: hypothetical protein ACJAZ9_001268 [Neolewinella sp.]|jgi:hypothetical protein